MPGVLWMTCGSPSLRLESADRDPDGVGERVDVLVPGLLEQSFGAERGGAGSEQRFEDGALLGGEVELPSVAGDGASERVELDSAGGEGAVAGGGFAAGERTYAQDELGEVEGLWGGSRRRRARAR